MNGILNMLRRMSKRTLVLTLAAVLSVTGVTAGTLAWLVDESNKVVNTFTYGDVDIELDESVVDENGYPVDENGDSLYDEDGKPLVDEDGDGVSDIPPATTNEGNEYNMVPGKTLTKDPKVTVAEGSEDCWVFVEVTESENFDDFMTYAIAEGWTLLEGTDNVYYMAVDAEEVAEEALELPVLANNEITVNADVTREMLQELLEAPSLSLQAFAVQREGIDSAAAAWEIVSADDDTTTTP